MDNDFDLAQFAPSDHVSDASVLFANRFNLLIQADELPCSSIARNARQRRRDPGKPFNAASCWH